MSQPTPSMYHSSVVAILIRILGISKDAEGAVKARLKYLQRRQFPAGSNQGRLRTRYDVTQIAGLTLFFKLASGFVTPEAALSVLRRSWDVVGAELSKEGSSELTGPSSDHRLAILTLDALSDLGDATRQDGISEAQSACFPGDVEVLRRAELGDRSFEKVGLTSIIDLTALAGELVKEIARETELEPADVRKAFKTLGSPFHDQERPS